jgi:secreted trypsin-like serine protease
MGIKGLLARSALPLLLLTAHIVDARRGGNRKLSKKKKCKGTKKECKKRTNPNLDNKALRDYQIPLRPKQLAPYEAGADRALPGMYQQVYGDHTGSVTGNCGHIEGNRIMGGVAGTIEDNPWAVFFLGCQDLSRPTRKCFRCGGSVISPYWVVTAASCTHSCLARYSAVIHGVADIKDKWAGYFAGPQGMTPGAPNYIDAANWKDVIVIRKHENYDARTHDYDIAVVATTTPMAFNDQTFPICLPAWDFCLKEKTKVAVMGWGDNDSTRKKKRKDFSSTLQITWLPIVRYFVCKRYHNSDKMSRIEKLKIRGRNICAGDGSTARQHVCKGDGGGPMVYKDKNGIAQLVGSSSFGFGCENFGNVAIYSRMTSFLPWIAAKTKVYNDGGVGVAGVEPCVDKYENIGAGTAFDATTNMPMLEDENGQIHGNIFLQNYCAWVSDVAAGKIVKFVGPGKCADVSQENSKWFFTPTGWIKNVASGLCWTVRTIGATAGDFPIDMTIETCSASDEEQHFVWSDTSGTLVPFLDLADTNIRIQFNKDNHVQAMTRDSQENTKWFAMPDSDGRILTGAGQMSGQMCAVKEGHNRFKRGQRIRMFGAGTSKCNVGKATNKWVLDTREKIAGDGAVIKDADTKKWCWNMNPRATKPQTITIHRCRTTDKNVNKKNNNFGGSFNGANWWQRFKWTSQNLVQSQVNLNNIPDGSNSFMFFNMANNLNSNKQKRKNAKLPRDLVALGRRYFPYTQYVGSWL